MDQQKKPYLSLISKRYDLPLIHPMQDFMGYGLRYSPDGAKGFIASGKTGIRIETNNGENIVITAKNPQLICDIVRKNK